jgi:hypothetical protein
MKVGGTGASSFLFAENKNDNIPIELMSSNAKHTGTPPQSFRVIFIFLDQFYSNHGNSIL